MFASLRISINHILETGKRRKSAGCPVWVLCPHILNDTCGKSMATNVFFVVGRRLTLKQDKFPWWQITLMGIGAIMQKVTCAWSAQIAILFLQHMQR